MKIHLRQGSSNTWSWRTKSRFEHQVAVQTPSRSYNCDLVSKRFTSWEAHPAWARFSSRARCPGTLQSGPTGRTLPTGPKGRIERTGRTEPIAPIEQSGANARMRVIRRTCPSSPSSPRLPCHRDSRRDPRRIPPARFPHALHRPAFHQPKFLRAPPPQAMSIPHSWNGARRGRRAISHEAEGCAAPDPGASRRTSPASARRRTAGVRPP